jgi:hypothetical protein
MVIAHGESNVATPVLVKGGSELAALAPQAPSMRGRLSNIARTVMALLTLRSSRGSRDASTGVSVVTTAE